MTKDDRIQKFCREVFAVLEKTNVRSITAKYSGYSDSGAIDEVVYEFDQGETEVHEAFDQYVPEFLTQVQLEDASGQLDTFSNAVESWVYELLPGGWEIGVGGDGSIEFDVARREITIDHEQNVEPINEMYTYSAEDRE